MIIIVSDPSGYQIQERGPTGAIFISKSTILYLRFIQIAYDGYHVMP